MNLRKIALITLLGLSITACSEKAPETPVASEAPAVETPAPEATPAAETTPVAESTPTVEEKTQESTAPAEQLKITFATEGAYAPFNLVNEKNELAGFDVDIAKALCEKMKADCKIVAQDWDGIIPGLNAKKYDAIIASMSITVERLKVVDFSNKYYSNLLTFVAKKEFVFDAKNIAGKSIGSQRGTVAAKYLKETYGDTIKIKLYDTQEKVYLDLKSGRIDAIMSDKFPVFDWLKKEDGKGFEFKGEAIDTGDVIGIAVRKGDTIKAHINKAIDAIVEDGTYKKINEKYFPFSIY